MIGCVCKHASIKWSTYTYTLSELVYLWVCVCLENYYQFMMLYEFRAHNFDSHREYNKIEQKMIQLIHKLICIFQNVTHIQSHVVVHIKFAFSGFLLWMAYKITKKNSTILYCNAQHKFATVNSLQLTHFVRWWCSSIHLSYFIWLTFSQLFLCISSICWQYY